jgi:hypothetical protein
VAGWLDILAEMYAKYLRILGTGAVGLLFQVSIYL